MSEQETMAMLVFAEVKHHIKEEDSLEDRCKAAFKAAKGHWMVTDEEIQFAGAIAAVYDKCDDDEKARVKAAIDFMKALKAATSGVPVDMAQVLKQHEGVKPIALNKLWREA